MDYQVFSKSRSNHLAIVDCPTSEWAVTVAELDIRRGAFQYIVDVDGARVDLIDFKARGQLHPAPDRLPGVAPGIQSETDAVFIWAACGSRHPGAGSGR